MPLPLRPRSTLERVYSPHYVLAAGGQPGNDLVLYLHPNGLAVVCLAPTHALLLLAAPRPDGEPSATPPTVSVSFGEGATSLLACPAAGKHKRGLPVLRERTRLATLSALGGARFEVPACVRCKLLEANGRLEAEPELVLRDPCGAGFLAILQPWPEALDELRNAALGPDAYAAHRAAAKSEGGGLGPGGGGGDGGRSGSPGVAAGGGGLSAGGGAGGGTAADHARGAGGHHRHHGHRVLGGTTVCWDDDVIIA